MLVLERLQGTMTGPIDLKVKAGECVVVTGASGAGKSLLLRAIVDLDVSTGRVSLAGQLREAMRADAWRRQVALVPAESGWWSDAVVDHFARGPETDALLEAVALPDALGWNVARLSSGEKHRLAIVRALEMQPKALLLDEPTAALDDEATERVEMLLRQRLDAGLALLLITHDKRQASRLGDRHYRLQDGTLRSEPDGSSP